MAVEPSDRIHLLENELLANLDNIRNHVKVTNSHLKDDEEDPSDRTEAAESVLQTVRKEIEQFAAQFQILVKHVSARLRKQAKTASTRRKTGPRHKKRNGTRGNAFQTTPVRGTGRAPVATTPSRT